MSTDAHLAAYRAALEFCGSLVTKPANLGSPILVCTLEQAHAVVRPPRVIDPGDPVVELVVQLDGVVAISGLRMRLHVQHFAAAFFPYPLGPDRLPVLTGWQGAAWCEAVDVWVTAALPLLPASGSALAGP